MEYLSLLHKWNQRFNLTAVRDMDEMVTRHLLDSLAVLPWVRGPRILDVGTGAGLPGIPLAVARSLDRFVLLDSNGKKTRFLVQVIARLGLSNVEVVQQRVEAYNPPERFATVVSRAFATIADMLAGAGRLCSPGGRIIAMKGVFPEAELAALPPDYRVEEVRQLEVPGLAAERHVVIMRPAAPLHSE